MRALALICSFALGALGLSACASASTSHSELDKGEVLLKGQFTDVGQMGYFYGDQLKTGLFTFEAQRYAEPLTLIGNCHGAEQGNGTYLIVAKPLNEHSEIIESEYVRDKKAVSTATHWLRACTQIDPLKSSGLLAEKTFTGTIETTQPPSRYDRGGTWIMTAFGEVAFEGLCENAEVGDQIEVTLDWSRPYDDPLAEQWTFISCQVKEKT